MRLFELFEAPNSHVTFCFGRMNPPTIGHKQLLDTCAKVGGDYKIFVSQTQDPKKNPLDYQTKINFIKEMFPQHADNVVEDAGLNTVVKVADWLYNSGYKNATFVAGSDRLDAMKQLLETYNGVEGKAHGYYKFEVLDFRSSGDREDGAEGVAGVSASNARSAAATGDFEAFKASTGAGQLAQELYDAVRQGMGIKEPATESRGHKIIATKLANMDRMKNVQIPTPAERKAEQEKKEKEQKTNEADAPKMVRDRKTGKQYDPKAEFNKLMNSPDTKAQMTRMGQEKGKGWPKREK